MQNDELSKQAQSLQQLRPSRTQHRLRRRRSMQWLLLRKLLLFKPFIPQDFLLELRNKGSSTMVVPVRKRLRTETPPAAAQRAPSMGLVRRRVQKGPPQPRLQAQVPLHQETEETQEEMMMQPRKVPIKKNVTRDPEKHMEIQTPVEMAVAKDVSIGPRLQ